MEIGAREGRQIAVSIGVGPQRDRAESVCVCVCLSVCGRVLQTTLVHNESQSAWVAEACAAGRKPIH